MKKIILLAPLFTSAFCFAQQYQLKLTNPKNGNITFIRQHDKVLMAVKVAKYQVQKKTADAYKLSIPEVADSLYVFTKGRIVRVNDSTIIMKERNSFFSATNREIRIQKINGIRKLTTGNQIFRTATTVGGSLAIGIMIFYSYAAVGGGEGFVSGMFKAAGTGAVLTRFGRTKISKKYLNNRKIEVESIP